MAIFFHFQHKIFIILLLKFYKIFSLFVISSIFVIQKTKIQYLERSNFNYNFLLFNLIV